MFLGTEIFHVLKAVLIIRDSMQHRKLQSNSCPWSVLLYCARASFPLSYIPLCTSSRVLVRVTAAVQAVQNGRVSPQRHQASTSHVDLS